MILLSHDLSLLLSLCAKFLPFTAHESHVYGMLRLVWYHLCRRRGSIIVSQQHQAVASRRCKIVGPALGAQSAIYGVLPV